MAQQDIRVTKTYRALFLALFSLLEKNSFQRVTVNDICQQAMVSRSTFYAHFDDKYALLRSALEELSALLERENGSGGVREQLVHLLHMMRDRRQVFKNLFQSGADEELNRLVSGFYQLNFTRAIEMVQGHDASSEISPAMLSAFCAGGVINTIRLWVSQGFKDSVETVVDQQMLILGRLLEL